ncbi:MAG: acetylornithine deacetylase [Rhodobacteraceae bacterium]|nr:acetylornithine deacetylase [Paracoccaceae bacterium]
MTHLETVEILERLVGFPTVSSETNLELIDWVGSYLNDHGIAFWLERDGDAGKAGLYALAGPRVEGGIILSGHSDVVPVEGQTWLSDPWRLTERGGRYYGRGTCDMKGFVAAVLSRLTAADPGMLQKPILLALSRDEEIGCVGARPLIAHMKRALPTAAAAIIGEPTMMQVSDCHKGGGTYAVTVQGHEVHSSIMHRGISAIMVSGRLIEWINGENKRLAAKAGSDMQRRFDPPYPTLHVGRIKGGTAPNITAGECRFDLEIRSLPDHGHDAILERFLDFARRVEGEMQTISPATGIELAKRADAPPLRSENGGRAEELACALTGQTRMYAAPYITEAGLFQEAGFSSVVCGPGDVAQAHCANEYIAAEQLSQCENFVDALIVRLSQ